MNPLSVANRMLKRCFDLFFAILGLSLTWWILVLAFIISTIDTRKLGIFTQTRIGKNAKSFKIFKIRTMADSLIYFSNVTTKNDPRITAMGKLLRKTKIDELPQLINILKGDMSFVGPRPDVPGYADKLSGKNRIILAVRPGVTGPATLKYCNEEDLLAKQTEPESYNREIIYPDKIRLNREYVENYSFLADMKYLWKTLFH